MTLSHTYNAFGDVLFHFNNFYSSTYFQRLLRNIFLGPHIRVPRLIATGSKKAKVNLWDIRDKELLMTVDTDTSASAVLILNDNILITTGMSNSLKVFRIPSATLMSTLYGHLRIIYTMIRVRTDIIATGSMDNTARVWNVSKGTCVHVLNGHTGAVCSLQRIDDVRIASGGEDNLILIWDTVNGTCLKMLQEHKEMVYCMTLVGEDRLVSGGFDNIRVWDLNRYICLNQFSAGDHYDMCAMDGNEIAVSHSGTFIAIWNINTSASTIAHHFNATKLGYIGKNRLVIGGNGFSIVDFGDELTVETLEPNEKVICMSTY